MFLSLFQLDLVLRLMFLASELFFGLSSLRDLGVVLGSFFEPFLFFSDCLTLWWCYLYTLRLIIRCILATFSRVADLNFWLNRGLNLT